MTLETIAHRCSTKHTACGLFLLVMAVLLTGMPIQSQADQPGRGANAAVEVQYLAFIIDHHFSALRMTELAAGTDVTRDADISPSEGTSPSPDSAPTEAKARLEPLKSLARRNNRVQREEILTAQRFLREWYGRSHTPQLTSEHQQDIEQLEGTATGDAFDIAFMQLLSRHHYEALPPSLQCLVGADPQHDELHRYCNNIVHAQVSDIQDMRHMLCEVYSLCDFQPSSEAREESLKAQ